MNGCAYKKSRKSFTIVEILTALLMVALLGSVIVNKGVQYYRMYRNQEHQEQKLAKERYYEQLSRIEGEEVKAEEGRLPARYLKK